MITRTSLLSGLITHYLLQCRSLSWSGSSENRHFGLFCLQASIQRIVDRHHILQNKHTSTACWGLMLPAGRTASSAECLCYLPGSMLHSSFPSVQTVGVSSEASRNWAPGHPRERPRRSSWPQAWDLCRHFGSEQMDRSCCLFSLALKANK